MNPNPKMLIPSLELGSPLEQRLSQASGALSDIYGLATDCVPKDAPKEIQDIFESIVLRILCSADRVRTAPSWYRFEWERKAWERYLAGDINACATDKPCNTYSKFLVETSKS